MSSAKKVKMQRMRNGATLAADVLFEVAGEVGELPGDVSGNSGRDAAGVEGQRVKPDGAQAIAD